MGAEGNLVKRVLAELNSWPETHAIKLHGSPYSRVGEPDVIGCTHGRMFAIEGKSIGKTPRLIQRYRLRQWRDAGATVGVFDTLERALAIVRSIRSDNPHSTD